MDKVSLSTDHQLPSTSNSFESSLQKSSENLDSQNGRFSLFGRSKKLDTPNQDILRDDANTAIGRINRSIDRFENTYTPALNAAYDVVDNANIFQGTSYLKLGAGGRTSEVPLNSAAVTYNDNGTFAALDLVSQVRNQRGSSGGRAPQNQYQHARNKLEEARTTLSAIGTNNNLTKKDQATVRKLETKISQYENTINNVGYAQKVNGDLRVSIAPEQRQ